jgi:hypothetical protein
MGNNTYPNYYPGTSNFSQPVNNLVWLQGGVQAAHTYPVAPGQTVFIMDTDNPVLYIKTVDQTGRPLPLEVYDLHKRVEKPQAANPIDMSEYVKASELKELIASEVQAAVTKALS